MKKYRFLAVILIIALSLSACGSRRQENNKNSEPTTIPETQAPTTMPAPSLPSVDPNVPEETEGRGSTDDTRDDKNESLPEEVQRIRRRIMG